MFFMGFLGYDGGMLRFTWSLMRETFLFVCTYPDVIVSVLILLAIITGFR
jgi:hypothetical protein